MSLNENAYEGACRYPYVTPDMFTHAALIKISSGEIIASEDVQRVIITTSPFARRLQNTAHDLPGYNISIGGPDPHDLTDRIAMIGIGANCAPGVLLKKFNAAGIGGTFFMAQASIENHAVVHSAFVGLKSGIPATIIPHHGTTSHITIGFFDAVQADALTETEPNYDLVHFNQAIHTRGLSHNPVLPHGALLYVSIWGALTLDNQNPLLIEAIPGNSSLPRHPAQQIVDATARILGHGNDISGFYNGLHTQPLENRLRNSFTLQAQNALPAAISGIQIREAALYEKARNLPLPMLPRITYL